MGRGKRVLVFLGSAVMLTLLFLLLFPTFWRDCFLSVTTGREPLDYTIASAGSDGTVMAAGVSKGSWVLTEGRLNGQETRRRTLESLGIMDVYRVDDLYVCSNGGALILTEEQRDDLMIRLYYLPAGDLETRLLYSGVSGEVEIDGVMERGGTATFLLREDGAVDSFRYVLGENVAEQMSPIPLRQAAGTLFVLPSGDIVSISGDTLSIDTSTAKIPEGVEAVKSWRLTDGVCLLDGPTGALWRLDMGTASWTQLLVVDEAPLRDLVSISVTPDGGILLLSDDGELSYLWDGTYQDTTGCLYRPGWQSGLMMAGAILGVLVISIGVWYFLCEYRKFQLSIVVRKGVMIAVLIYLLVAVAARFMVRPSVEDWSFSSAERYLKRAASDEAAIPDAMRLYFEVEDGKLYLLDDGSRTISSVLGYGKEWRQAAEKAVAQREAFQQHETDGIGYFSYFVMDGSKLLEVVQTESASYLEETEEGANLLAGLMVLVGAFTLIAVIGVFSGIRVRLRRITEGLDALHAGTGHVYVVDRTGDEIGAMALSLNSLADSIRNEEKEEQRRGDLYARFLPAKIAELLGEKSVESINKSSFASSRMGIMHVSFTFDKRVYETRSKALFDNINEITESAAKIIAAKGGTILSFSHEGFDAFFPAGDTEPISAAVMVCQEAAAINEARRERKISPVSLHIALDEGEVMLGVVGDENRMQVTAVSSSFSNTQMLTGLFGRFEASILCTEEIQARARSYGRRYIGKAFNGTDLVRVYELFDGDSLEVRQSKAETVRNFTEGVYTLYSGDYSAAKRTFMEISRENNADGVAKFYLYLADRFEKEPPEEVSLDC